MKIINYRSNHLFLVKKLLDSEEKDPNTNQAYDLELFSKNNGTYFKQYLAIENKEIVGVIVFSSRLYSAEINYIYVKETMRGKGVAKQLTTYVEEKARKVRCEGITVNTAEDNLQARKFYKKMGYKQNGKVFDYFNHNKNQIFYHKKL